MKTVTRSLMRQENRSVFHSLILILLSLFLPFLDLLLLSNDNSIGQSYHLLVNKFFGLNWVYCVTQIYWLHIILEDTSDDTQPINRLV